MVRVTNSSEAEALLNSEGSVYAIDFQNNSLFLYNGEETFLLTRNAYTGLDLSKFKKNYIVYDRKSHSGILSTLGLSDTEIYDVKTQCELLGENFYNTKKSINLIYSTHLSNFKKMKEIKLLNFYKIIYYIEPILCKLENFNVDKTIFNHKNMDTIPINYKLTYTGRLTTEQPSLYSLKQEYRKAFYADEDKIFIHADFRTFHPKIVASVCNDEKLIEIFNSGEDFYEKLMNFSPEKDRKQIKIDFNAWVNGRSNIYLKKCYPKFDMWKTSLSKEAEENGFITDILDCKIPIVEPYKSQSYFLQRAESVILYRSIYTIYKRFEKELPKARIRLPFYDAILFDTTKEDLEKTVSIIEEEMTKSFIYYLPQYKPHNIIKVEVGNIWGDIK